MLASDRASGPALPLGAQPQVHPVGLAAVGVRRQQPDQLADHAGEVLVGADAGGAPAGGLPLVVVDEHQVDVAGVVQLLAAELAEGQHGTADGAAVRGGRLAEPAGDLPPGGGQGDVEGGIGHPRNVAGNLVERPIADDVVGADAQQLAVAKAAEGPQQRRVVGAGIDLGEQAVRAVRPGWDSCRSGTRSMSR